VVPFSPPRLDLHVSMQGADAISGTDEFSAQAGISGFDCQRTFTGTRVPDGDPCSLLDAGHLDPGLGDPRDVHACDGTWMVAALAVQDQYRVVFLHWDGSAWRVADRASYCANPPAGVTKAQVGEADQASRIYAEECGDAPSSSTSTTRSTTTSVTPTTRQAPTSSSASCDQGSLVARVKSLHPGALPPIEVLACGGGYAVVAYGAEDGAGDLNVVLAWNGQSWQPPGQSICALTDVPAEVHLYACATQ
jgi:hypothetical protein